MMVVFKSSGRKFGIRSTCFALLTLALFAMSPIPSASQVGDEDSQQVVQAATLIQSAKLDEAEGLLWQVLTSHPENAEALNLLGSIRLQQKRYAESETLLRRAISLAPGSLPAYINLAHLFQAQGEDDKEVAELLEAERIAPNNSEVNCSLAAVYLKEKDFHLALGALERIPRAHRPDAALPLLATSYLGLDRVADARALEPVVAARATKNPGLQVEFAEVLLDFDLTNEALSILETAQKQQKPSAELFFALGRARERKGELALAQKDFRRALELNPNSVNALQELAHLLADQGQWEKSLELLRRARTSDPESPEVLRKFAATSLHAGHASDAADAAQQLVKLRPNEPEALYLLGVAQLQNGDWESSRATLESYTKLRPQDALALLALGMADTGLHNVSSARENFEQSIKVDPNQAEPYYQLALILRDQGDNSAAIAQLEKAISLDKQKAPAQAVLGTLYLLQQDYVKAQEHLTRAALLSPDTPDTHYQLGLLYARLNQHDRAQREMEQFRKLKDKGQSGATPSADRPATSTPTSHPS